MIKRYFISGHVEGLGKDLEFKSFEFEDTDELREYIDEFDIHDKIICLTGEEVIELKKLMGKLE